MSVMSGNRENFEREVMQSEKTVLLDFWADWCGPCKMVAPVIEEIANACPEVKVVKVNVDEEQELAAQFGIMSIPTLVVMKNGTVVNKAVGAMPKREIMSLLKK